MVTDRCPVGCGHCSVDSRPDSPTVTDYELYEEVLAGIAASPTVEVVAISGGEPFADRRALQLAVSRFRAAGLSVVIFTSGYWAGGRRCQPWIERILAETSTVVLSTDSFHQGTVARQRFAQAAGFISRAGCRLVVQALDEADQLDGVRDTLVDLYGPDWPAHADLVTIPPLPHGRGQLVFQVTTRRPADQLPPCRLTRSPTVRYDGVVVPCCNERVVMGAGPAALRRRIADRYELLDVLDENWRSPVLAAVGAARPHLFAAAPGLADLASDRFESICGPCWRIHEEVDRSDRTRAVVAAIGNAYGGDRK
nr:radical SAM protein [Micromonospora tarapacensis]